MQAIEGFDLAQIARRAREKHAQELHDSICGFVGLLLDRRTKAEEEVLRCKKALDKAEVSLDKIVDKLCQVSNGDWGALQPEKQDK